MKAKPAHNKLLRSLILCTPLFASPALFAQTSWNVDNLGNWSAAANWNPSVVPDGSGAIVNFTNNITAARTITIDDVSRTVGILNIGDSNNSHRFIIARTGALTLTLNNGVSNAQINETGFINASNPDAINAPVILASNLTVDAGGQITLQAGVSETGGSKTITKTGTGILSFTQNNTYTGVTNVNSGSVFVGNNGALGTTAGNTIVAAGARVYGTAPLSALAEAFTISGTGVSGGNGALQIGGGGTTNMSGAVTLGAAATIGTDGGVTLTMTGGIDTAGHALTLTPTGSQFNVNTAGISGAGSVIKNNTATVTFNAANSHSVSTALNQGTITVGPTGTLSSSTATLTVNNTNSTAAGTNVVLNLSTGSDTTVGTLGGNISIPTSGTNTATINTQTGRAFTVHQTSNSAYAGVIAGNGGFALGSSSTANLTLSGAHTYTGPTSINAGTLKLGSTGSLANGTSVGIAAGATFDLTDKTAASATYTWNMTALIASGAATAATITGTAGGTIDMGATPISLTTDATNPCLTVTGADLALSGNSFNIAVPGPALPAGIYPLVSASSITGTVNATPSFSGSGLVSGGSGVVSISGNTVILTVTVSSTPYDIWATSKGLTVSNKDKNLDPDKDGRNNLAEFAFNGDPLSGSDNGKVFVLTEDSDFDVETANKELLLTVAVRTGTTTFSGTPSPTATQAADGITYSIEGSLDLAGFLTTVNVVPTPVTTDLPPAGAGYEYRTFSLEGSNGLPGKGFLRAKVTAP
jgi:fibronectin-binding autotransporter adhesin